MSVRLQARVRDSEQTWNAVPMFWARSRESGFRTAAKKLGLKGRVLTVRRAGENLWEVNVNGKAMMVAEVGSR